MTNLDQIKETVRRVHRETILHAIGVVPEGPEHVEREIAALHALKPELKEAESFLLLCVDTAAEAGGHRAYEQLRKGPGVDSEMLDETIAHTRGG